MATTIEGRVSDLLLAHLEGLEMSPSVPVAFPNVPFTPPAGTFLAARLMPNTNANRFIANDSKTEFLGILQVIVSAPGSGGIVEPMDIAGSVADHFERDAVLEDEEIKIRIDGRPSIAPPLQEADRVNIPVSVRYYAFA